MNAWKGWEEMAMLVRKRSISTALNSKPPQKALSFWTGLADS
jgi:hypothetical protein